MNTHAHAFKFTRVQMNTYACVLIVTRVQLNALISHEIILAEWHP